VVIREYQAFVVELLVVLVQDDLEYLGYIAELVEE
jgi:hypothetical protein